MDTFICDSCKRRFQSQCASQQTPNICKWCAGEGKKLPTIEPKEAPILIEPKYGELDLDFNYDTTID